jgi:ferric-dicitrate binding protein FerR (iron transport regulator)
VLGTAFNISSYAAHETIRVTVARGKVAVNSSILLPNDQLAYTKTTGKSETRKLQSDEVIAWMQRKITFNDESFKTVAALLADKYHVKIQFDDKQIGEAHFTGRFEATDDLYTILDALTLTRGLSYEVKGAVITITNN